ncbi:MAG: hypothetical protein WC610_00650 [Patescibacteria group bacterium]
MFIKNTIAYKEINKIDMGLTWLTIEKSIKKETDWLKSNIFPFHSDKNPLNLPDDTFYRLIAILIVSGQVKTTEYFYDSSKIIGFNSVHSPNKEHGTEWHNNLINYLHDYFEKQGFEVYTSEPMLYYGQADLKVISEKVIYFEIDTVGIFKLWVNLKNMKNINIIILTSNKIIKFEL